MFYKVVGSKGARREILAPLLPGEYLDREGLVLREGKSYGRGARDVPVTGSNTAPVGRVKKILSNVQNNQESSIEPEEHQAQQQGPTVKKETEQEAHLTVQRASPKGQLGSQVSTNGRRPSTCQQQWTQVGKRKGRGSRGSPVSPDNLGKKFRDEGHTVNPFMTGDWEWDRQ